ncbi:hypothetical protein [Demequina lignilytica]|uniref:Uncharacterized protein n=1 Tax=Demequina lignilytica TaxID=3051663 RepID=A0AB35MHA8_9MICO|nr:hypothetical protein [Demequina sp. SYSU T0a273]MDN4483194.1 hypothetical protein [Demequina sp. SYSU T0a273]
MRRFSVSVRAAVLAAFMGLLAAAIAPPAAASPAQPGMCQGVRHADVTVIAHANGAPSEVPKFILNLWTDADAQVFGTLVLGKGAGRLEVTDWCRLWYHEPGMTGQGGDHEDEGLAEEGATIVHAVGVTSLRDGTQVMVRVDVRGGEDGDVFRVRYRPWPVGHDESATEHDVTGDEHEDEPWVRVPIEGWYPLTQLRVSGATAA